MMPKWDVTFDYPGGDSERIEGIRANTAEMALRVAGLIRTKPITPSGARIKHLTRGGEPVVRPVAG